MTNQQIIDKWYFKRDVDSSIKKRIRNANKNQIELQKDIVNSIALWKLNRVIDISDEAICLLTKSWKYTSPKTFLDYAKKGDRFLDNVMSALNCKGIGLPMATTILHFYNPNVFPIMDQRACRTLNDGKKLKREQIPSNIKSSNWSKVYINYIDKCYKYWIDQGKNFDYKNVDKLLYGIDKEKNNKLN